MRRKMRSKKRKNGRNRMVFRGGRTADQIKAELITLEEILQEHYDESDDRKKLYAELRALNRDPKDIEKDIKDIKKQLKLNPKLELEQYTELQEELTLRRKGKDLSLVEALKSRRTGEDLSLSGNRLVTSNI